MGITQDMRYLVIQGGRGLKAQTPRNLMVVGRLSVPRRRGRDCGPKCQRAQVWPSLGPRLGSGMVMGLGV